jgi:hypothetical protein
MTLADFPKFKLEDPEKRTRNLRLGIRLSNFKNYRTKIERGCLKNSGASRSQKVGLGRPKMISFSLHWKILKKGRTVGRDPVCCAEREARNASLRITLGLHYARKAKRRVSLLARTYQTHKN